MSMYVHKSSGGFYVLYCTLYHMPQEPQRLSAFPSTPLLIAVCLGGRYAIDHRIDILSVQEQEYLRSGSGWL